MLYYLLLFLLIGTTCQRHNDSTWTRRLTCPGVIVRVLTPRTCQTTCPGVIGMFFFLSFAFILLLLTTLLGTNWICLRKITNEVGKDSNSRRKDSKRIASRVPGSYFIFFFGTILMFFYYNTTKVDDEPKERPKRRDERLLGHCMYYDGARDSSRPLVWVFFLSLFFALTCIYFKLYYVTSAALASATAECQWRRQGPTSRALR